MQSSKNIIKFSSIAMLVLVLPGLMLALSAGVGQEEQVNSGIQTGCTLACIVQLLSLVCGVMGLILCGRPRFCAAILFPAAALILAAMAAAVAFLNTSGVIVVPQLTALGVMLYGVYGGIKKTDN